MNIWSYLIKKIGLWDARTGEIFLSRAFNCQSFSIKKNCWHCVGWYIFICNAIYLPILFFFLILLIDHFNGPRTYLMNTTTGFFFFKERGNWRIDIVWNDFFFLLVTSACLFFFYNQSKIKRKVFIVHRRHLFFSKFDYDNYYSRLFYVAFFYPTYATCTYNAAYSTTTIRYLVIIIFFSCFLPCVFFFSFLTPKKMSLSILFFSY